MKGCDTSAMSSPATLSSADGVDAPEVSEDVPLAAAVVLDEVAGPGVVEVGPKYFNNSPEKIIH